MGTTIYESSRKEGLNHEYHQGEVSGVPSLALWPIRSVQLTGADGRAPGTQYGFVEYDQVAWIHTCGDGGDEMKHTLLQQYYPDTDYTVCETTGQQEINNYLNSKSVTCWAQGPVGKTGFYKLVHTSPNHVDGKSLIIVCRVNKVRNTK